MSPLTTSSREKRKCADSNVNRVQGEFSFAGSWGMGYEGFSKTHHMHEMNLLMGNKREYFWLFGFMLCLPLLVGARSKNEEGLHAQVKTTNRFARVSLDAESARINATWSA